MPCGVGLALLVMGFICYPEVILHYSFDPYLWQSVARYSRGFSCVTHSSLFKLEGLGLSTFRSNACIWKFPYQPRPLSETLAGELQVFNQLGALSRWDATHAPVVLKQQFYGALTPPRPLPTPHISSPNQIYWSSRRLRSLITSAARPYFYKAHKHAGKVSCSRIPESTAASLLSSSIGWGHRSHFSSLASAVVGSLWINFWHTF